MKVCLWIAVVCLLVNGMAVAAPTISANETHVTIESDGAPLLTYRYGDAPFKPYVQTLTTPAGLQLLRDAPHDHLHHHALMYAIGVDGVSYWAETEKDGKQNHLRFSAMGITEAEGFTWAGFTEELTWTPPGETDPVLLETRVVGVMEAPMLKARLLTWKTSLETAEDVRSVKLTGVHYYGLGMRFLESMDNGGKFLNAAGIEGEIVRGDERNTPADWCAYQADADGKPVTVVMFGAPANKRHPAMWFTMGDASEAFAYLSATLNLLKEEMKLKQRSSLNLTYGVALMDGHASKEDIAQLYEWWKQHVPVALK